MGSKKGFEDIARVKTLSRCSAHARFSAFRHHELDAWLSMFFTSAVVEPPPLIYIACRRDARMLLMSRARSAGRDRAMHNFENLLTVGADDGNGNVIPLNRQPEGYRNCSKW